MIRASRNLIRLAFFTALAALIAGLSYRFFFPGYFQPFAIYHEDHFIYRTMGSEGHGLLIYLLRYPRPVAHILIDLCGRLGLHYLLMPIFLLSFLNAGLAALWIERAFNRKLQIFYFVLFAALAFANPDFYVHLKADPFAVFALTFLLLIFHNWQSYRETGRTVYWLGTALLVVIFSFTKESYFCALGLFFLIQIFRFAQRRKAAIAILLFSTAAMASALYWNSTKWVRLKPAHGDPYYTDLSAGSVLRGVFVLSQGVLYPAIAALLIAVLAVAWFRSRSVFFAGLAALALGLAALLPNAALPNHLEQQYACLAIFFVLAPLLLLSYVIPPGLKGRIATICTCFLTYCLTLGSYQTAAEGEPAWVIRQEQSAMNLVAGLEQMKRTLRPFEPSLVTGIVAPYNPFRVYDFSKRFFGEDRFLTVIVPAGTPERATLELRVIHESNPVRLQPYAHWFLFSTDERLIQVVDHPSASAIAPELSPEQLRAQVAIANQVPLPGAVSFYASPNPVKTVSGRKPSTTVYWNAPVEHVEIHIDSPEGPLFASGGPTGHEMTDNWLTPGMVFYLVRFEDSPPVAKRTLAQFRIQFAN